MKINSISPIDALNFIRNVLILYSQSGTRNATFAAAASLSPNRKDSYLQKLPGIFTVKVAVIFQKTNYLRLSHIFFQQYDYFQNKMDRFLTRLPMSKGCSKSRREAGKVSYILRFRNI